MDAGDNTSELVETQKFTVGETVAWIDSSNRLMYGVVIESDDTSDRVKIQYGTGKFHVASPHRERVAHLLPN